MDVIFAPEPFLPPSLIRTGVYVFEVLKLNRFIVMYLYIIVDCLLYTVCLAFCPLTVSSYPH